MTTASALPLNDSSEEFRPGLDGFTFEDLYRPAGLKRLHERFLSDLAAADAALAQRFEAYRQAGGKGLKPPEESALLIAVTRHLSAFIGRLFGIASHQEALAARLTRELRLFEFRREFITRRVFKKGAPDRPTVAELPALAARVSRLMALGFPSSGDEERDVAEAVLALLEFERLFSGQLKGEPPPGLRDRWAALHKALAAEPELLGDGGDDLAQVRRLISLLDRWTFARALHPEAKRQLEKLATHVQPRPLVYDKLVELRFPDPALPEAAEGHEHHLRRRDGFKLTDRRYGTRRVMAEVEYCILCHEREKDSCSKGFKAKDPVAEGHSFKKNPLGIPLTGCPLDERISEAHLLKGQGDSVGAVAMIALDNPMLPGTGHRICNDCMKSCIYQKQEPVNIPQIETSALTDLLALPYGFEIYGLLTRWNPLDVRRPHALPYLGKNVLVVGMGPAGYTLAHYLLNEGFGVAGVDGLKIEPFPDALTGKNGAPLQPIRDFSQIASELDDRTLAGFGGVSEYGITVRWDKNFLTLLHLTLARRENLRIYGGVRFGGTLTLEDAWDLGFDHVAIAAGAGRPTVIGLKNNLIRGIRKASDFLMALQLTGAFKRDSLANLQVQLPAIVIGGGLTAIDTATELLAYYPVQVEKVLERYEVLTGEGGTDRGFERFDEEERRIFETFLEHGRAVRAERQRAAKAGEPPDFISLVRGWGGVSICYRRTLTESPAYRLNHEEVAKALEEGIRFIERMSPTEAVPDDHGAVKALRFERMTLKEGKLKGSGEFVELPAKTVCVAAGTSPNVTYEKEHPGTFKLDKDRYFFQGHQLVESPEGAFSVQPVEGKEDLGAKIGFFTSYSRDGRFVSFYGDNHPTYAGNVVKAMASAKDGYPEVLRLFEKELRKVDPWDAAGQRERDQHLGAFFATLDDAFRATVVAVNRLTPTIVEVIVRAPFAARHFRPGQFYRLQNYETQARVVHGTRLSTEGLALTGAWMDRDQGLLSTIVLEMGSSSRLCAALRPGEPVVLMGPTGTPTEIPRGETVLLAGGGLGNAVLFSIARALKAAGCRVIYFAGYRQKVDLFKQDEIEAGTDQIVWSVDQGELIAPRRPQDGTFLGNVVQAMLAYGKPELHGELRGVTPLVKLSEVDRIIAIGSDRMMRAVKEARHTVLQPYLKPGHEAIGSINSPMQCMMKEICAQCLQKHVDPVTGKESVVFSCFNQDQKLDHVDFTNLNTRLRANGVLEKLSNLWLDHLLRQAPDVLRI